MKRTLIALTLLVASVVMPARDAQADSVVRDAVVSCAFGAGAFAALAYVYVSPIAASGALAVPMAEVVAANALLGCGFGVAGSLTASAVAGIYDAVVPSKGGE